MNTITTISAIAGLIAAVAFAVLVVMLIVPLVKLGRVLDDVQHAVRDINDGVGPLLEETTLTVTEARDQLKQVDVITSQLRGATANVQKVTGTVSDIVDAPVSKFASLIAPLFGFLVRRRKK